jgi:hypothetical protein
MERLTSGMEQRKQKQRLAQQIFASQQQLLQRSFKSWQHGSKQSKVGAAVHQVGTKQKKNQWLMTLMIINDI